jgi:exonuclease SbcC
MIPVKLQLRGFLSYRDLVEVDFSDFELACISGQNGAGKSSLLDAITWALFGEARRRDDAVINSGVDTAEVSLEFDYEGNRYRVLRNKRRGKTAMLEFNIQDPDGNWKVLTEHTLSETEKRIRETLRLDYETFTNASFILQGKADQFTQQPPGKRKLILSSILGLEVWETYKQSAAERRKSNEQRLAEIEGQLKEIEGELAEEGARRERLAALEKELHQLSDSRKTKEQYFQSQVKRAAEVESEKVRLADLEKQLGQARQRHQERLRQLAEREQEQAAYQSIVEREAEIEQAYSRWQAIRQQLGEMDRLASRFYALQQQRAPLDAEIQREIARLKNEFSNLAAQQGEVEAALKGKKELERALETEQRRLEAVEAGISRREALKEQVAALREERSSLEQQIKTLTAEMEELEDRLQRLSEAHEETCPLCESHLDPEKHAGLIQKLNDQRSRCEKQIHSNQKRSAEIQLELKNITSEINKNAGLDAHIRQAQKNIATFETQLRNIQTLEEDWQQNGAPRLALVERELSGEQYAAEARQKLSGLDARLQDLGYDASVHENLRLQEQELRPSEAEKSELDKAKSALTPLSREINSLKKDLAGGEADIQVLEQSYTAQMEIYQQKAADLPDLKALERELNLLKSEENLKHMAVGAARQKVEVLKTQKERQKEFNQERSEIKDQITRLKMLEKAFGKDGVPALLIEQALPEIENEANLILDRLSNGTMSVSIETLREYKDPSREDKKETLDIIINDNGHDRAYELFSGGEAFRVNFAIRLALSRVLARRAGARLQTLVIDEGFGSQDSDGRQRLIEAINMVRDDFAKILVITHLEELKDAFPARVEVEKTTAGSSVRVMVA